MASLRRIGSIAVLFVGVALVGPARGQEAPAPADSSAASPADDTDRSVSRTDVTEVEWDEIEEAIDRGEWQRAVELVRRRGAAATEKEASELRILEARLLDRRGEVRGAVALYHGLLEDEWVAAEALTELHDLYVRSGYFSAADELTAAASVAPDSAAELATLRAYSLSVQGRYAESARLTEGPARSGSSRAQVLRGNALLVLGDSEAAEELYLRVLRESSDPELRQVAHFGLGQVARRKGGRALRALQNERAAETGPAPWAELDWGLALRALGRRAEARDRLESVAEEYPALASTARLAIARLEEEEGRVEAAIEHLASALDGSVGDFLVWTRLGDLLIQEGRDESAIEAYRRALAIFPAFPPGIERLTRALAARGRWEEAPEPPDSTWLLPGWTWERLLDGDLPFYELAADRDSIPQADVQRGVLALIHARAGFAAAVLGWTDDVSMIEGLPGLLRAQALEHVGRSSEALPLWEAMAVTDSTVGLPDERWARALFASEPERALAIWADYLEHHPDDAHSRIRLGEMLESAERLAEARDAYVKARANGWLSAEERRRLKIRIEDLEDSIRQASEGRVEG